MFIVPAIWILYPNLGAFMSSLAGLLIAMGIRMAVSKE